jgi:hypothetical protein
LRHRSQGLVIVQRQRPMRSVGDKHSRQGGLADLPGTRYDDGELGQQLPPTLARVAVEHLSHGVNLQVNQNARWRREPPDGGNAGVTTVET